jgi:hypothetical protein
MSQVGQRETMRSRGTAVPSERIQSAPVVDEALSKKEISMGSETNFPPAGEPKGDPKKTTGKTMEQLTEEKRKEMDEKIKKGGDENIKYAPPGRSDIIP